MSSSALNSPASLLPALPLLPPRDCKHIRSGITLDVGARATASPFKVIILTGRFEWLGTACFADIRGSCSRGQLNIIDFKNDWKTAGAALFRRVCPF